MIKKRLVETGCVLLLLFIAASCASSPDRGVYKKQAESSRTLGEVYMTQKNYTAALRELLKSESLNPDDPYLHNDLGLVYMAKQKPELAIRHFKKALELRPDYAAAKNNLGTAYLVREDWDAAIASFKEVSEDMLYATPHYSLSNMAWAYYNKRQYDFAEKYYQESLKLIPDFPVALRGLGLTYMAMGKIRNAVEAFERGVRASPSFPPLYFDLAEAYVLSRNYEKALYNYRKVIQLAPGTALAERAQKEIQRIGGSKNS
jgi:Tfp pilus assembly protein PilF